MPPRTARDYQRAAEIKVERLRKEEEYREKRDKWESEHQLDEVVDVNDIAAVVHQWTGIPGQPDDGDRGHQTPENGGASARTDHRSE